MLETVAVGFKDIQNYRPIVGDAVVDQILALAAPLRGARVLHLSATAYGGGVAELLSTLVPLMRSVGLDAEWRLMAGAPELWDVTKGMHNLLQGATLTTESTITPGFPPMTAGRRGHPARPIEAVWTPATAEIWQRYNALTADWLDQHYDFIIVHDPQPLGVLAYVQRRAPKRGGTRWIWRCHIDLTKAQTDLWAFLRPYLAPYDAAIFTMQDYVKPDLPVPEVALIAPAIDPLSPKNLVVPEREVEATLRHFGVAPDRPLITQVSRFDPWKDPLGVIDVYRRLKRQIPGLQLALVGSMASDDPEAWRYFEMTARHAGEDPDIHLLTNSLGVGPVEVNVFQRASQVVLQKSIREGFALTVSEAMWKGRPVVATNVGGIPLQVASGRTGYLVTSDREAAARTLELLRDLKQADAFGLAGRERVRENFLITRYLNDYIQLFRRIEVRASEPRPMVSAA
jgi:trehalose synthase